MGGRSDPTPTPTSAPTYNPTARPTPLATPAPTTVPTVVPTPLSTQKEPVHIFVNGGPLDSAKPTTTRSDVKPVIDLAAHREEYHPARPRLFCFAVMMPSGYELPLLRELLSRRLSLFGCDEYSVFSDGALTLGHQGMEVVRTTDAGNVTCPYGGIWYLALNTEVFVRIWRKVIVDAKYATVDWTV